MSFRVRGTILLGERRGELLAAATLLGFALGVVVLAARMPLGSPADLGPGAVPLLLGGLLVATSVGLVVRALRLSTASRLTHIALGHARVWLVLAALGGLALAFERLGYLVAIPLFLLALLRLLAEDGWVKTIVWTILFSAGSYLFFSRLLGVNLPLGLLKPG